LQIASGKIISNPPPPGLITSKDFSVNVNGKPIWVEHAGSKLQTFEYTLYNGRDMEDLNIASFSFSRRVKIKITASSDIDSYLIRPKTRNISAKVKGRNLIFILKNPQKLYIEINNLPHLALFANPLEVNPPQQGDPGVVYFGPGNHNPGQITLESNQTIYIAGGAIVTANIRGENLNNVRITGRGILQGNVRINGTDNLNVDGIFIRNTRGWSNTLTDCHNSSYRNVKVFGYEAIYSCM
jgi:hypothetical protein